MDNTQLEQLIIERMNRLEDKIDQVRVTDLPAIKTELAIMVNNNKASSKLHATLGSTFAVLISMVVSHFKTH